MTLPFPTLLAVTLAVAILDWFATARGWRRVEFGAKPGVMILLLLWFSLATGLQGAMLFFGLGILLSLLGDVFLMFKGQGWFLASLGAFLLAHVSYVIGFNITPPGTDLFGILTAIFVAVLASRVYRRMSAGLIATGRAGLRWPILAYTVVISLMLVSGLLTLFRPDWLSVPSLMAASGAALFFFSDALLGWNWYVKPVERVEVIAIISYHLGQFLLIVGVTLNFLHMVG